MSTVLDRRAARAAQHTAALAAAAAPQRLDLYAPIHKALRHLMMDTLLRVGRLDVADPDELNATLGQLDELLSFCAAHVAHENDFVHAAMEARRPGAAARTADDHGEHLDAIEALRVEAEGLRAAPADAAAISALRLYRHLALFVAENFQHMHVEETANNAALWAHYRDDELVALHERLLASIPPAEHLRTARWMVPALTPQERAGLLGGMRAELPAPAFAAVVDTVRPHLDATAWRKLAPTLDPAGPAARA
jgi:hypothetical protein